MNSDAPLLVADFARSGRQWLRRDRAAMIAVLVLLIFGSLCFLAPLTAPYDPIAHQNVDSLSNRPPSRAYPMGTDEYSRDVLSRWLYGGRLSLTVALFATLVSVTVGTAYGAAAGYADGWVATILDRILDALLAVPRLLLMIAILAAWHDELTMTGFIVVLGVTGWYALARLVRGQVLALKTQDFVASARALGATRMRILTRHILPNIATPVVVAAMLGLGHVIVLEAGLSWLGIGVDVPQPSWGNMIQEGSTPLDYMASAWWVALFPGLAIMITVIAFNVLGDALLRALSPRQSGMK
jgi:peptide/nickel transport system permease protein